VVWFVATYNSSEPQREQRTMLQRSDATGYDGHFRDGSLYQELTLPRAITPTPEALTPTWLHFSPLVTAVASGRS
jgi:hypothetical protein